MRRGADPAGHTGHDFSWVGWWCMTCDRALLDQIARLTAERDALRAALVDIASGQWDAVYCTLTARAALAAGGAGAGETIKPGTAWPAGDAE